MLNLSSRQKFLLAFIESFMEPLGAIDLMKLLFLYCKQHRVLCYSFFPYLYGCFSYEVYKDKRALIEKGFLVNDENHFIPVGQLIAFSELKYEDRAKLSLFKRQTASLRGNSLIRKTYLEYPEYAKLSTIREDVLSPQEIATLFYSAELPFEKRETIYTIGYEGISIDEYLRRLVKADIDILIDVRKNPKSMKFDFNSKKLADYLKKVSIAYEGMPDLGIPSAFREHLDSDSDYQKLFDFYEVELLPLHIDKLKKIADLVKEGHKVVLTCFEKDYNHCHRYRIAKRLREDFQFEIVNL